MALIDISSLLQKQANPEQQALIQKLGIPANQVITHTEFIDLVVKPILELQGIVVNIKDGEDGVDGKSAYQLAVDEGFSGTLSEWLAQLKGPKGDSGIQIEGSLVISQTTGSDDSAVMSQAAVTAELEKKASAQEVNDLAQKVNKVVGGPETKEISFKDGGYYSSRNGELVIVEGYSYISSPIAMKTGDTALISCTCYGAAAICFFAIYDDGEKKMSEYDANASTIYENELFVADKPCVLYVNARTPREKKVIVTIHEDGSLSKLEQKVLNNESAIEANKVKITSIENGLIFKKLTSYTENVIKGVLFNDGHAEYTFSRGVTDYIAIDKSAKEYKTLCYKPGVSYAAVAFYDEKKIFLSFLNSEGVLQEDGRYAYTFTPDKGVYFRAMTSSPDVKLDYEVLSETTIDIAFSELVKLVNNIKKSIGDDIDAKISTATEKAEEASKKANDAEITANSAVAKAENAFNSISIAEDSATSARNSATSAELSSVRSQESATNAEEYAAMIKAALQQIIGTGNIPEATIAKVLENSADIDAVKKYAIPNSDENSILVNREDGNGYRFNEKYLDDVKVDNTFRFLLIGSSFGMNTVAQFPILAHNSGVNCVVANVYKGSWSINSLAEYCQDGVSLGDINWYQKFKDGSWMKMDKNTTIKDILKSEKWDVISVQRGAAERTSFTDEMKGSLETIIAYITKNCDNSPKIVFNSLFSYPYTTATREQQIQETNDIMTTANIAKTEYGLEVIPVAPILQNIRNIDVFANMGVSEKKMLCYDTIHLDPGIGCYVTGCILYEFLLRHRFKSVLACNYLPTSNDISKFWNTDGVYTEILEPYAKIIRREVAKYFVNG